MELVFGIITIFAGIIFIVWQIHKERRGLIVFIIAGVLLLWGPIQVIKWLALWNRTAGIIGLAVYILAIIISTIYACMSGHRWSGETASESAEIWQEVYRLPVPDAKTIQQYKIANRIPLYPENSKTYTDAAINAWRRDEYNKRMKEKHMFRVNL